MWNDVSNKKKDFIPSNEILQKGQIGGRQRVMTSIQPINSINSINYFYFSDNNFGMPSQERRYHYA